jgi:hypothetical protein
MPNDRGDRLAHMLLAALAVAIVAGDFFWNDYAYGDWTCMFKRCVMVQNVKDAR